MIKLCIWMNIPSHYQAAFFRALNAHADIDLQVRYLNGVSSNRAAEGWSNQYTCSPYEQFVENGASPKAMLDAVPEAVRRLHIVSGHFSGELADYFCEQNMKWCHWSEMPGIRLAELLNYRMGLFRILNPLMLSLKRAEGRRIEQHGVGAFGQGILARKAFQRMGVSSEKISDLYYVPSALPDLDPSERVISFANGRKVFIAVGALCRRKGIDVLLKAFARSATDDWCLVLCGLDKENGIYQALATQMGLTDQVLFMGAYPSDRIAEVYWAAHVFVLASRFDGWGAVLNEAASVGLPLIGTDLCGASWHVVQPDVTGYRVKAGSVAELALAMRRYVDEPELCDKHGSAAMRHFIDHYTPEKNVDRLIDGLREWRMA